MSELQLTRNAELAWVTIDRPERKHAWAESMWGEMAALVNECASDSSVRVVLIASTGDEVFSAGADLEQFRGADAETIRRSLEGVESVMASIESCPKPVIAVVGGAAVGAGLEVAAACDVRIASDNAWFSIPAATLGIVITKSDIARLVRGVGGSVARYMLLTGRRLTAVDAKGLGFVLSVHDSDQLHEDATQLATRIVALEASALSAMKAHLNSIEATPWDEGSWLPSHEALLSPSAQDRIISRLGDR